MIRAVILLVSLSLLSCGNSNSVESFEIDYSDFPHQPIVDIYIGEEGPFPFLIDTASTQTTISADFAKQISLKIDNSKTTQLLTVTGLDRSKYTDVLDLYISRRQVHRKSRLLINEDFPKGRAYQGLLGISALLDGKVTNNPQEKALTVSLPSLAYECDSADMKSRCHSLIEALPQIKAKLASEDISLFLDTGNVAFKPFILFKSNYTNDLWTHYGNKLPDRSIDYVSDKPVKGLRTQNFEFGSNDSCYADVIIRNPQDNSPKLQETYGTLGWRVIKKMAFEIDFATGETLYQDSACPYGKLNTIGIGSMGTTKDQEEALINFVAIGSPADIAGLRRGDMLQRITLSDGEIIEKFDGAFAQSANKHMYAPAGNPITLSILRGNREIDINLTTRAPQFTAIE